MFLKGLDISRLVKNVKKATKLLSLLRRDLKHRSYLLNSKRDNVQNLADV